MLSNLNRYHILLASKSPRRRELLQQLRLPFHVVTISGVDESYPQDLPLSEVAEYISKEKAQAYRHRITGDEMIITADTVVICEGKILGKPKGREDAVDMLLSLSGKTHLVATGVTISTLHKTRSFTAVTEVKFGVLTREEVEYYVANYSPYDKAGAYGIQEWIGCVAVESINGSFYNVMGLPIHQLYHELKNF